VIVLRDFLTKETFAQEIEKKVLEEGCTYFNAIIEFAEDCNKDPEELVMYMSPVLLDKVKKSAQDSGLIDLGSVDIESLMG
jgi:hypothetical protein